jgi:hypothetical protein
LVGFTSKDAPGRLVGLSIHFTLNRATESLDKDFHWRRNVSVHKDHNHEKLQCCIYTVVEKDIFYGLSNASGRWRIPFKRNDGTVVYV